MHTSFMMLPGADQERFCKGVKEDVNDPPYTPRTYRGEVLTAAFFNYVETHFKVILSRKVLTAPR